MDTKKITLCADSPFSPDAAAMMRELSDCLESITGNGGQSSFQPEDVCNNRSVFVIARNRNGEAVGCGALRPIDETIGEIKRMYSKVKGTGTGSQILTYLEHQAADRGYRTLRAETRAVNIRAVSFYLRNGYKKIPNYGKYAHRPEAVCFEKAVNR